MKYQLVLQWSAASVGDYDRMVAIETRIMGDMGEESEVDGHDAGSGQVNIFVHTNSPERAFDKIRPILHAENALASVRVAYRQMTSNKYTVMWPMGMTTFNVA